MQDKLFEIPPIRIPRPTKENIDFSEVYLDMTEDIIDWDLELDEDDILADLKKYISINEILISNGYELAKKFEDDLCLEPDAELVEILDGFSMYVYDCISKAEKEWVKACNITPSLSIGDLVEVEYRKKPYQGKIYDIKLDKAEYIVNVPDLGHVEAGQSGTNGLYFHFEDVEKDFLDKKHWEY